MTNGKEVYFFIYRRLILVIALSTAQGHLRDLKEGRKTYRRHRRWEGHKRTQKGGKEGRKEGRKEERKETICTVSRRKEGIWERRKYSTYILLYYAYM